MNFYNRETFKPSKESLKKYLSTRKEEHTVGGSSEKPLISDSGVSSDSIWVYLVFAIEFLGLILTIIGGAKRSQSFLFIALGAVILIIIFDIVAGIQLHRNVARNIWIDAKIPDLNKDEQQQLKQNKEQGKLVNFFLVILLIIIAIFKTIALFFMHPFPGIAMYIPMALLFLLASYIHIYHTGYFLAYKKAQQSIKKDYNKSINQSSTQDIDEDVLNKRISTYEALVDLPLKSGYHRIDENPDKTQPDEDGKYKYLINIHKLITDDEALMLCNGQTPENQRIIFKKCRERQFELINVPSGIQI